MKWNTNYHKLRLLNPVGGQRFCTLSDVFLRPVFWLGRQRAEKIIESGVRSVEDSFRILKEGKKYAETVGNRFLFWKSEESGFFVCLRQKKILFTRAYEDARKRKIKPKNSPFTSRLGLYGLNEFVQLLELSKPFQKEDLGVSIDFKWNILNASAQINHFDIFYLAVENKTTKVKTCEFYPD